MDRNFPSLTQSENRPKKRNRCPRRRWQVLFFLGFKITWNNELAQNWRRSTSGLYIVTLLVKLLRREHHAKCWAGGSASWNRDCQETYQQPQICRYHCTGRKWKGTKEPLDEGERGVWKARSKLNIHKTKIMASGPITSWQVDGEIMETVIDLILLGSKITADDSCSHEIKRHLLLGRKVMTNLDSILKSRDICQQRLV